MLKSFAEVLKEDELPVTQPQVDGQVVAPEPIKAGDQVTTKDGLVGNVIEVLNDGTASVDVNGEIKLLVIADLTKVTNPETNPVVTVPVVPTSTVESTKRKIIKKRINEDDIATSSGGISTVGSELSSETPNSTTMTFQVGDKVQCPGGRTGVVESVKEDGTYMVNIEGEVIPFQAVDLTKVESAPEEVPGAMSTTPAISTEQKYKTFAQYCLTEELSEDDIKKIKEVGHATAKEVHGDQYKEDEASKLIDDVIEQNKDKDPEAVSAIVQNSFRSK